MRLTIHRGQDQTIEKGSQALGDKAAGKVAGIAHHSHHVVILEQGEGRPRSVKPGDRWHAEACHEVVLQDRGIDSHVAVGGVQVNVAGAPIIACYITEYLGQVAVFRCGHDHLRFYCHYFLSGHATAPIC
ncbi:hypothetical protein D3C78_1156480 [compost metagenome]